MINDLSNGEGDFLCTMTQKEVEDSNGYCWVCGKNGIGYAKLKGQIDQTKMRCRYCHRTFRIEEAE